MSNPNTQNSWGTLISDARKKKNMTQAQLADLLQVDPQSLSNWEREKNFPSPDSINRLESELGIRLPRETAFTTGSSMKSAQNWAIRNDLDAFPKTFDWLLGFMQRLFRAGASTAEVEAARALLTSQPAWVLYGSLEGELVDARVLPLMKQLGDAILEELKSRRNR